MCSILNGNYASRAKQPRRKNEKRAEKPSSLSKSVRYSFALAPPSLRSLGRRSPLFSRAT